MIAITLGDAPAGRALRAVGAFLAAVARGCVTLVRRMAVDVNDFLHVAGAGLVAYGAWMVFPPAGFIVAGLLLLVAAALGVGDSGGG